MILILLSVTSLAYAIPFELHLFIFSLYLHSANQIYTQFYDVFCSHSINKMDFFYKAYTKIHTNQIKQTKNAKAQVKTRI